MNQQLPACFLLMAALVAPSVGHAGTIEQNNGGSHAAIGAYDPIGQSFLAEDAMLGSIAFAFSDINPSDPNEAITMTLYQGEGFGGSVIHSVTQVLPVVLPDIDAVPALIDFDFSGTPLTVGQTYTAAVTTGDSWKVAVIYSELDSYSGGQMFLSGDSVLLAGADLCWAGPCPVDLIFRVTPVPEAEDWTMMLAGLGLLGWAARRRKQSL